MAKPTFEIEGRSTGRGAFTGAVVIRPDGQELPPDRRESSRTGNHWTSSWYQPIDDCLILVEDISNSGKDNSYEHRVPKVLSPEQREALTKFKKEHRFD